MTDPIAASDRSPASEPGPPEASVPRLWVPISALLLAMLLAALDQTIVSTALPTIVSDLGGLEHLSWVVTAYMLASTAATPLWGKLGDMYGRKRFFQASIVIFLLGSVLCGIAQNMGELIAFRALQGLGGGGLMVLSQAIVGDLVSPRDRGKYQGLFGAVFGVTSVLGPLLGGLFVDNLSWRWVFYINLPIGVVALVVIAAVLHGTEVKRRHRIDYLGTVLIASVATCLVLMTSLGGTTWEWSSWQIVGLGVLGLVLLVAFVLVERAAAEPVLPLRLFRSRTFSLVAVISFVVGFAMFGALTYLPTFLQVVMQVSPTMSGIHMLPMVLGMLVTSIGSGQIVARTGHYRIFPIAGTAVTTVGLLLLSRLDEHSSTFEMSCYFLVFGLGLGLVMQVLVLIVQNSVGYQDLGVATAGATFFRSIGASFGVSVFGTVFASGLNDRLQDALAGVPLPPGFNPGAVTSDPRVIAGLPPDVQDGIYHAYAESITRVFLYAVPVAVVAFVLSLFLREQKLRSTVTAPDLSESIGLNPVERSSLDEIARALSVLSTREARRDLFRRITKGAGLDLKPASSWLLLQMYHHGSVEPAELAERRIVPMAVIEEAVREVEGGGLASRTGGLPLRLTEPGEEAALKLVAARREQLSELLGDWDEKQYADLADLLNRLSSALCADERDRPDRPDLVEPERRYHAEGRSF
ncbi:MFS transporter [Streptomyces sp. CB01881]|uniref:MFS transporter n=1 Tax=Streptomyces sp. CB01881 TaxID=2078691 RepID=UPI000CDC4937|nr:MFS transporter [Streptomyces sp. CB01881]AUY51969.1 EmrB/QacA family drug resistance transporter [Streptomyces sp. CB01881]TYC71400.1 MFS transporter [Streptomyces sp. CB01881]